jgi:hypothetical protein
LIEITESAENYLKEQYSMEASDFLANLKIELK